MNAKTSLPLIILFTLLITACTPAPTNNTNNNAAPAASANPATPAPDDHTVDHQTIPDGSVPETRTALLVEIEGEVSARENINTDFSIASVGLQLAVGAEIETGANGRSRVDLVPDGTIVRLGPNTYMLVTELTTENDNPQTSLQLFFGQVWILLNGGDIELETESGLAVVRGSMMSVAYDPDTGDMEVTCLEGHCSLENDLGQVDLIAGQAASIPGAGAAPNDPYPMSQEHFEQWKDAVPEAESFAASPPPEDGQNPPPQDGEPGAPPPDDPAFDEPITYSFTNLCYATWHWEFSGDKTYTIDVPPGGSVSGEIPPGIYDVHDWADNGFDNGSYEAVGGTDFNTTYNCPDPDSGAGDGDAPPPPPDDGNAPPPPNDDGGDGDPPPNDDGGSDPPSPPDTGGGAP